MAQLALAWVLRSPTWPRPSSAPAVPSRSTTTWARVGRHPRRRRRWPPSTRPSTGWSGPRWRTATARDPAGRGGRRHARRRPVDLVPGGRAAQDRGRPVLRGADAVRAPAPAPTPRCGSSSSRRWPSTRPSSTTTCASCPTRPTPARRLRPGRRRRPVDRLACRRSCCARPDVLDRLRALGRRRPTAPACCRSTSPGPSRRWPTPWACRSTGRRPTWCGWGRSRAPARWRREAGRGRAAEGAEDLLLAGRGGGGHRRPSGTARPDADGGGGQAQQRVLRPGQRHRRARRPGRPADRRRRPSFCAAEESWPSFEAKIEAEGAIVEELVRVRRPAVAERAAAHRPRRRRWRCCRPTTRSWAGPRTRCTSAAASRPGPSTASPSRPRPARWREVLAARGRHRRRSGSTSWSPPAGDVYLSEINLRMGGTTHPFWMARLADRRRLRPGRRASCVVPDGGARLLRGHRQPQVRARWWAARPADVIARVDRAGLAFDPSTGTGRHPAPAGRRCPGTGRWASPASPRPPRRPTTSTGGSSRCSTPADRR